MDPAYKMFSQVVLENLDPESSYEYGQVHLRKKKYSSALNGFRQVPNGHPLYDLASYYGGVCAVKTKNYQLGLDLMDQAVVLPSKLMRSRKVYQRHAQGKILENQKQMAKEQEAKQSSNNTPSAPVKTVPVIGFINAKNNWGVDIQTMSQNQDFSEIQQVTASKTEIGAFLNGGKDFSIGKKGLNSHFHLSAQLKFAGLDKENSLVSILEEPEDQYKTLVLNQDEYSAFTSYKVTMAPEWNIGGNTWLGLGLSILASFLTMTWNSRRHDRSSL